MARGTRRHSRNRNYRKGRRHSSRRAAKSRVSKGRGRKHSSHRRAKGRGRRSTRRLHQRGGTLLDAAGQELVGRAIDGSWADWKGPDKVRWKERQNRAPTDPESRKVTALIAAITRAKGWSALSAGDIDVKSGRGEKKEIVKAQAAASLRHLRDAAGRLLHDGFNSKSFSTEALVDLRDYAIIKLEALGTPEGKLDRDILETVERHGSPAGARSYGGKERGWTAVTLASLLEPQGWHEKAKQLGIFGDKEPLAPTLDDVKTAERAVVDAHAKWCHMLTSHDVYDDGYSNQAGKWGPKWVQRWANERKSDVEERRVYWKDKAVLLVDLIERAMKDTSDEDERKWYRVHLGLAKRTASWSLANAEKPPVQAWPDPATGRYSFKEGSVCGLLAKGERGAITAEQSVASKREAGVISEDERTQIMKKMKAIELEDYRTALDDKEKAGDPDTVTGRKLAVLKVASDAAKTKAKNGGDVKVWVKAAKELVDAITGLQSGALVASDTGPKSVGFMKPKIEKKLSHALRAAYQDTDAPDAAAVIAKAAAADLEAAEKVR